MPPVKALPLGANGLTNEQAVRAEAFRLATNLAIGNGMPSILVALSYLAVIEEYIRTGTAEPYVTGTPDDLTATTGTMTTEGASNGD